MRRDGDDMVSPLDRLWPGSRYGARVPEGAVERARAALARGDVLIAYDEAVTAVDDDPDDLDARFVAALTLARAGATGRARDSATELVERVRGSNDVSVSLREDTEALVARLVKDEALEAVGNDRRVRLLHAAGLYEAVDDKFGGYYSCINAATLYLLAGETDRAHRAARRAQHLVSADRDLHPADDYWREATAAEAALVLDDLDTARSAILRAASLGGDDLAAFAITRRQLRLVCDAIDADTAVLGALASPVVLHYCGHRIDSDDSLARFPPSIETAVARQVRAFLTARRVGFGYGSLASGSDIIIAEALLDNGAALHVVLPFASDEFERVSVAPAGRDWSDRFWACLGRARSVVVASDSSFMHDDELFGYAGRIAMGHALNRAAFLDAPVEQLAIWDGVDGDGVAGTAHDVAVWRHTGNRTQVVPLPPSPVPGRAIVAPPAPLARKVGAILFADFRGFSRLRDEHFPVFVNQVLAALGAVLDRRHHDVLWRNSWGDAIGAVFADVTAAADCAIALQDTIAGIDLASLGLPTDLTLRIGAHAGPVMVITDPIGHRPTYWGREITRAARIEPRTPEGEVYVTDAFAALLALQTDAPFGSEYMGRIRTAKDFETIPMYRLYRRTVRTARNPC